MFLASDGGGTSAGKSWGASQYLMWPPQALIIVTHLMCKSVDEDHCDWGPYPKERYPLIYWNCQPWAYVIESSLYLLEYVVLMTGKIWQDVTSEDLVNVAESCKAIFPACANILEDHRSNSRLCPIPLQATMLGQTHGPFAITEASAQRSSSVAISVK